MGKQKDLKSMQLWKGPHIMISTCQHIIRTIGLVFSLSIIHKISQLCVVDVH
jgi:hypothetical protein